MVCAANIFKLHFILCSNIRKLSVNTDNAYKLQKALMHLHFCMFSVYFYNFGMPDFGVSSLVGIIDGVKVLAFAVREGRVAVHCHAGLGRTGTITQCQILIGHVHGVCQPLYELLCMFSVYACDLLNRCPDSLLSDLHPPYQCQ